MSKNDVMDTDEERKGSPPCSASASRPQAGRQLSGPVSEMQFPPVKNVISFFLEAQLTFNIILFDSDHLLSSILKVKIEITVGC